MIAILLALYGCVRATFTLHEIELGKRRRGGERDRHKQRERGRQRKRERERATLRPKALFF
jgi:hypothetical protein